MGKIYKTKEPPTSRLAGLHQRLAELEISESERKQIEETLKESEEFSFTLLTNSPHPVAVINPDRSVRYVNPAFEKLTGFTSAELIGRKPPYPYWTEETLQKTSRDFEEAMSKGAVRLEEFFQKKNGERFWVEITSAPVTSNGEFKYYLSNWFDITERKQMEEALQAEKNKLKSIIDALEYNLTIQDKDFNIIYQNEPSRISSGGDHLGEKCYRVYEGRDKICHGCPVKKAFKDGKSHTAERKRLSPSGEVTFWENTANPVRNAGGEIVSCIEIGRDITGRKQMEEALRDSEEKLERMFESVTEGISVIDLNGVITEANKEAVRMHGFGSKDELLGKSALDLVAPCDHERIAQNIRKALKQGTVRSQEYTLLKSDGSEFPGELSTSLLKDASGNPIGHVTISRDITERKEAEEREKELQQELLLSSRLASIGELAAGVAHQINNPLTGVLGFSQRLLRKSTDQEISQDLGRIYTEAERAAKVVQNLLTFARRRQSHKQYSDINEILQSALELRAYELKTSNIEVVTDLARSLPQIMVDFHQIQEVFLNIILNAEQVMTEANSGGRLTIKTEERKGYIKTTFTDDGPGIPAEHLDKLFDPFFSTKGERGGTGLGLSVCHGIISEHGGRIYAKSKPGKGATFFVELPLAVKTSPEVAAPGRCQVVTKMD
jgi:two-component system NtrC family sensor kinase